MKYKDFVEFRNYLEDKKDIFELPKLPDTEWQYILSEAKNKAGVGIKKEDDMITVRKRFPKLMFSPRLAAVLVFALFILMFASYARNSLYAKQETNSLERRVEYKNKNTMVPVKNVSYSENVNSGI